MRNQSSFRMSTAIEVIDISSDFDSEAESYGESHKIDDPYASSGYYQHADDTLPTVEAIAASIAAAKRPCPRGTGV